MVRWSGSGQLRGRPDSLREILHAEEPVAGLEPESLGLNAGRMWSDAGAGLPQRSCYKNLMSAMTEVLDGSFKPRVEPVVDDRARVLVDRLGSRSIALVGMMGAGKTVIGRRLAARLGVGFIDTDHEIEAAACLTIPEIFDRHGEAYFRDRECRVVARLIGGGPRVVATGGGAFIHAATRAAIRAGAISVWLKADFDVLMRRVRKRSNRPLLQTPDPEGTMQRLMDQRYPIYAEADVTVVSRDGAQEQVVRDVLAGLEAGPLAAERSVA
jgi:shikimate kinase